MKKKLLLMIALLCATAQGAWADKWDGKTETQPRVYNIGRKIIQISSAAELAYISSHFHGGVGYYNWNGDFNEVSFDLLADLDMTAGTWKPIGGWRFEGTFYGNGHTIRIKIDDSSISSNNQGLFETIGKNGRVRDLHVGGKIKVGNARMVGAIAGNNYGTIENCWVSADVESNHYSAYAASLGGITGYNESSGNVKFCCMSGNVTNTHGNSGVGGIVGCNDGTIRNVTFYGKVSVDHDQDNKYVGDQDGTLGEPFDSFNENEYNIAGGNNTYRRAIKYVVMPDLFVINNSDDWNTFDDYISHSCSFRGKTVRLDNDITTSKIAGSDVPTDEGAFSGIFDGNGHTITAVIDYKFKPDYSWTAGTSLFRTINGATIKNLKVAGRVTGGRYAGAIVGFAKGTGNRIENCTVTATVQGSEYYGGIVGHALDSDIAISGCVFNSVLELIYVNKGVFIGSADEGGTKSITDCLYVMNGGQDTYALDLVIGKGNFTITNSYKTTGLGSYCTQATVASPAGIGAQLKDYGLVKAYEHGIWYDGRYYVDSSLALPGAGTEADPVRIGSTNDWNKLANCVNGGYSFSDNYVKLTSDISVSEMAGTSEANSFQGTFDGGGKTLTLNYDTSEPYTAPFRYTKNATVKNLRVAGTITTSAQFAGGIVAESHGALSLTNCRSSVAINSSVGGDGTHGGLIGTLSGRDNAVIIDGCVFDGSFATTNGTTNCGGFVGWPVWNKPAIKNSLMKPGSVTAGMLVNTFARWHEGYEPTITNCYYVATDNLPTDQGTHVNTVATRPANLGDLVQDYGVLKAYQNGILYDVTYYVAPASISLADNADNSTTIRDNDGYMANVTLQGRTFYRDGSWNTLCLPFNVTLSGSPLEGAVARPLTSASISGTTLNLEFGTAVTELVAGTPYIIKWGSGDNIVSPVFKGVTIDKTAHGYDNGAAGDARVRFIGTYNSLTFDADDKSLLFMGGESKLHYPAAGASIGAQRAYFKIGEDRASASARIVSFSINFGDGETTGIDNVQCSMSNVQSDNWYSLDGRKLNGKPTQPGVYINGGRKVVIK